MHSTTRGKLENGKQQYQRKKIQSPGQEGRERLLMEREVINERP